MANWRLAKSLTQLRKEVNAAYPARSKASDGSIGDAAHSARTSDHNPDSQGRVCAIDITHDPKNGVDGKELSKSLIADSRMKYVIFAGKIYKARTGKWETYTGPNKHDKHVHISVKAESADDNRSWILAIPSPAEARVTAGENAPEPVVEQPKDPPPKEINAETATTVNVSKPSVWEQFKDVSIPTGIGGVLATIGNAIGAIPPWGWALIIAAIILGTVYLISQRNQRAQEKTLKAADIAADPEKNNVYFN